MKKIIIFAVGLCYFFNISFAQNERIAWKYEVKAIENDLYELSFIGTIQEGYYIYSQQMKEEVGPVPTSFEYSKSKNYSLIGECSESGDKVELNDPLFDNMHIIKYKHHIKFAQKVKVLDKSKPITGYMTYMTCNETQCDPPKDYDFSFDVNKLSAPIADTIQIAQTNTLKIPTDDPNCQGGFNSKRAIDAENFVRQDCGSTQSAADDSLWQVFILSMLGGFLALLTPCVFPMVPLTVSFFTKRSKSRAEGIQKAIIYGLSIIFIYVFIGVVITSIFGPNILNQMATNPIMNLVFFIIFIIFALSFFGFYEITLPSSWSTSTDQAADKGGLIGIFFMAFTLALVSFSCTGPIIGSLLVQTSQNVNDLLFGFVPLKPMIGMFGFSLALALPFALFAMFPSWLSSLPKSGGWMTNVKVTLGFLELALALKFLSTADLVGHWGFLRWEVFLGLWALIFAGLALYQFGKILFPHDVPLKKMTTARWVIGSLSAAFVVYLLTGFNYKPLSLLSGLAPSYTYNFFGPKGCVHGIECFHDFDTAIAYAQKVNKPLFIDFTGYGCVNCRKMEENVWSDPSILKYLKEDYVVVSLYVDDDARLFPEDKQKYLFDTNNGSKLRTVGSKWASFQVNNFKVSSQPYYVLMKNDGKTLLTRPVAYEPNVATYKAFLECGVQGNKK